MGILRCSFAEGFNELKVFRGIHEVVLATDDVGDSHGEIVYDIDEVENEGAVGSPDHHVGRVRFVSVVDGDFSTHQVLHRDGLSIEAEAPCAIIFIDTVSGYQLFEPLEINITPLALIKGTLPVESHPFHAFKDCSTGLFCVSCFIGIFYAEDERPPKLFGIEPVEKSGAGSTKVEVASGRGGKAGADRRGHHGEL